MRQRNGQQTTDRSAAATHSSRHRSARTSLALLLATAGVGISLTTPTRAQQTDPFAQPAKPLPATAVATDPFPTVPEPLPLPATSKGDNSSADAGNVHYDDRAGTVTIHVKDTKLVDVLRMLSAQSQKNIIASKSVTGTVTCNLYDVTFNEAMEAILLANGYVAREKGNFIYIYSQEEVAKLEAAKRVQESRVFRVYHISPASAAVMIRPVLSETSVVSLSDQTQTGISPSKTDAGGYEYAGGDVLVLRDYPENLLQAEKLLEEIDRRPQQILVEATILSASLAENNALGIDFNIVGGVDFTSLTSSSGQIINAGVGGAEDTPASSVGTGNSFTGEIPGGLKVGFVSGSASMFLSALEGVTDTVVLANPKVLALNKQRGEVLVGREDGYLTTITTDTAAVQQVQFIETGTKLVFRPYVSDDGFIRMEIHPEDSTGGLNEESLPFKVTTEVTTNVLVKDGHTLVIGGLFRESTIVSRSQVPVLGNIPVAGTLFRQQRDITRREEIIILLTPHIVKDATAYSKLSEEELRRGEKLRVGVRQGLMPTGRERLAQGYYQKALDELGEPVPDYGKAEFYTSAALNLVPTFREALQLKEQLSGRKVVEADMSTVRSFVRRAMLEDMAGPPEPAMGVPEVPTEAPEEGVEPPAIDPLLPEPSQPLTPETDDPMVPEPPPTEPEEAPQVQAVPATRPASEPDDLAGGLVLIEPRPATRPTSQPATRPTVEMIAAQARTIPPTLRLPSGPKAVTTAQPTTQPADVVVAAPATQPADVLAEGPTTQPLEAIAEGPTTRPARITEIVILKEPTTRPVGEIPDLPVEAQLLAPVDVAPLPGDWPAHPADLP